ncbi:MAG: sigma-E factor regulatory protein RseB domain-containing protein [Vulcanimicrobiaceae bacterium]
MRPKLVTLAFAPAACALAVTLGATAPQTGSIALLRAAMDAPAHISYIGEVQTMRIGKQKSETAVYRVYHRAPNLTRRWYLAPQDLYGDSIVTHGKTTYSVDVKRKRIVVTQDDANDDQVTEDDNFGLLAGNYRALAEPEASIDGHHTNVIALVNKYTGQTTMRVWIDSATKLLLQKEQFAPDGSLVTEMRFSAIHFTNAIPNQFFAIPSHLKIVKGPDRGVPSQDYARIVKTAGFQARSPKYLPDGFFAVAGDVMEVHGVRTVHLLYSDGIRTVSLFENAHSAAVDLSGFKATKTTVEHHDADYVVDGPTTLLTWSEQHLHFALVGELDRSELQRIAASVVP